MMLPTALVMEKFGSEVGSARGPKPRVCAVPWSMSLCRTRG
jgi:hypothetical protein